MTSINNNNNAHEQDVAEVRARIEQRVQREFGVTAEHAVLPQIYEAAALCVRDEIMDVWAAERERSSTSGDKCLIYLCAEFLIGRAFSNNLVNLGLYDTYAAALAEMGYDFGLANTSHDYFDTSHTGTLFTTIGVNF